MCSLPFEDFDLFPPFHEDVFFGGFEPVQLATMMGGEGESPMAVGTQERPWKKVVASDGRAASALRSHSEAERRRRERINAHLSTLRSLVPGTDKLDKAGLLAQVINYVRELKIAASEINDECNVPSDADEVRVELHADGSNPDNISIKASLCCEDRPELLPELRRTVQAFRLRTAEAEISTLGGRVKNVFVVSCDGDGGDSAKHRIFANTVHHALNSVLDKVSPASDFPLSPFPCKRRRLSPFESSSSSS